MTFKPDTTITEAEFKRPLLDADEERLALKMQGDSALRVDALRYSVLGRLLRLITGRR